MLPSGLGCVGGFKAESSGLARSGRSRMIVANATIQRPRTASDSFSLFFTPFHMLVLVSMVLLVCSLQRVMTMAQMCLALG